MVKITKTRICKRCGKEFEPESYRQAYCTLGCREKARTEKARIKRAELKKISKG